MSRIDEKEEGEGGEEENKSALVDNLDSISKIAIVGVSVVSNITIKAMGAETAFIEPQNNLSTY